MAKPPKPTERQKRFVAIKLANPGIPNRQAALQAGYSVNTADNATAEILEKPGVKAFIDLLAPDKEVAEVLNEGLYAWKRDQYSGEIYPDFKERRETAREIVAIKGYKRDTNLTQVNIGSLEVKWADGEDV